MKDLLPSHFVKFILYPPGVSLLSYMCQDLARIMDFRIGIWKEVALHIRKHQQEGNPDPPGVSLGKVVNQSVFIEDPLVFCIG